MSEYFLPFLLTLILLAFFLRDNFILTLLYLIGGAFLLSRIWNERAILALNIQRVFSRRIFFGEELEIQLQVRNNGRLPIVWMRLVDGLPADLSLTRSFRRIVSLPGRSEECYTYRLVGRKRGYYAIGPLSMQTGDILGLVGAQRRISHADRLIVYPKILPLPHFTLPSAMPLGSLPFIQPVYEDPNRVVGKRPYMVGDSLRRVDWKATAQAETLQVKIFEPSISMETALFVNLNPAEYYPRQWVDSTELAVVSAASIATWLVEKRQAVGLATNGRLGESTEPPPLISPRKGRPHLIHVLETLAGLEVSRDTAFATLIRQDSVHLPWGGTALILTGSLPAEVFDELLQVRRRGIQVAILLIGPLPDSNSIRQRVKQAGMASQHIYREDELKEVAFRKPGIR